MGLRLSRTFISLKICGNFESLQPLPINKTTWFTQTDPVGSVGMCGR